MHRHTDRLIETQTDRSTLVDELIRKDDGWNNSRTKYFIIINFGNFNVNV